MSRDLMRCFVVERVQDKFTGQIETRPLSDLPPGDVLIQVEYSSLNYKDALGATGHPGVAKSLPHVPGIDAAGTVVQSGSQRFQPGDSVIVTGYELGTERWGAWSEFIRLPADWVIPLPSGLTLEETMILGTAGFTAAQSVDALVRHQVTPEKGPVVVTGASGGVGSFAVMILSQLGYHVIAVTGKEDEHDWLRRIGATEVAGRELLEDHKSRPLQSAKFAGGVDVVGGAPLAALLKMTTHRGCVACCGLTAGAELHVSVFPFILRGVTLAGIDSAWCPAPERMEVWNHLAGDWKPAHLHEKVQYVPLEQVGDSVAAMLADRHSGRTVVTL